MAAPYVTAVRTALKGARFAPGRWLLMQRSLTPPVCWCLRLPHVSPAASLCSSKAEPQRSSQSHSDTSSRTHDRTAGEEEPDEGPEYIPKRKAKNPMIAIGYAWMIGLPTGIITFVLAKRQVDKNRLKQLKVRQRMKHSNDAGFEGSRYLHHKEGVKLDR